MREFLVSTAAFSVFAGFLFFVLTRWYRHLIRLSERYDVQERRRIAARHYLLVLFLLIAAMVSTLLPLINYTRVPTLAIALGFVLAVAPSGVWWLRQMPALKALGYGGTSSNPTNVA